MNSKTCSGNRPKLRENQTKIASSCSHNLKSHNKTLSENIAIKNKVNDKSQNAGGSFGKRDAKNERPTRKLTKNNCSRHTLPKIKVQSSKINSKTENTKSNTSVKKIVVEISKSYHELVKNQDSKSKPFVPFLYPYQARFQRNSPAANKKAQIQRKNLIMPRQKCSRLKKSPGNFIRMNTAEDNGNIGLLKPTSSSNEDLSEYTDADESISAPTEFLAEFLSAVMLKDYETALKYCKLILQYEPNNITAKEFYPLIIEKLKQMNNEEGSSNDSEDEENDNSSSSTSSESESSSSSNSDESSEDQDDEDGIEMGQGADKRSKGSSDGDATTGSYSSLEDDEAETDQLAALAAKYQIDNVNLGNGNKIYATNITKTFDNKVTKANIPFGTSSDSESPTEPVSQQTVAMLRAKVVPTNI